MNKLEAKQFRKWRRSLEISQQEVADNIKCHKSTICRWEKGDIKLADNLYKKLLEYVNKVNEKTE